MKKRNVVIAMLLMVALAIAGFEFFYRTNPVPSVSAQNLFKKLPTITPYAASMPDVSARILQKYAKSEIITRSAHGFEISAANFRVEEGEFRVDICHQNPNSKIWTVGDAVLQSGSEKFYVTRASGIEEARVLDGGERQVTVFPGNALPPYFEKGPATGGEEDNYRCDTLSFRVPSDVTLSRVKVTIKYMNAFEDGGCYPNRDTVQSFLDEKGANIKIDCSKNDYPYGAPSWFTVIEKPGEMAQEEAEKKVSEAFRESLTIQGPWVFEGEVMNMNDPAASVEPLATEVPVDAAVPPEETVAPTP